MSALRPAYQAGELIHSRLGSRRDADLLQTSKRIGVFSKRDSHPTLTGYPRKIRNSFDEPRNVTYLFNWRNRHFGGTVRRGTQAEFLDKGKPVVRPGRKAMGLACEIARLPKGTYRTFSDPLIPTPRSIPA